MIALLGGFQSGIVPNDEDDTVQHVLVAGFFDRGDVGYEPPFALVIREDGTVDVERRPLKLDYRWDGNQWVDTGGVEYLMTASEMDTKKPG